MSRLLIPFSLLIGFCAITAFGRGGTNLDDPYATPFITSVQDTVPQIKDRQGDFINDSNFNPFDLKDPGVIEKNVEYDPESGLYIISEKIGDDYFRPPTYMTFDEYLTWQREQEEQNYFDKLAGVSSAGGDESGLDPITRFDVKNKLLERLFGGTTVDIRPQGSIDLTFGFDFQRVENPILTERQRTQGGFDFDMNIQMNVTGKIGEKLNLNTNYNTNATFDFDNQIKLDYNSDNFSEDEIIKKIEAGNVSLPLQGSLIQGAQSLFGLKTELQFGYLRLTALAAQQRSQSDNIQIQGGSQVQEFEVRADEYDENRHFFLSHYNRDAFEPSLENLPQIKNLFQIENIEVWITNDRNEVENVRDIVAFADLGEPQTLVSPDQIPPFPTPLYREICDGLPLPDNGANGLYNRLVENPAIRQIDQAVSILQSSQFGLTQAKDFEKVSARKLDQNEYTFNPDLGFISLNINVRPDQVLGVSFQYSYNGNTFKVGELANNVAGTGVDTTLKVLYVKMLKSTTQRTDVPTWDLMMKNVYSIGAFQVNQEDFRLDIFYDDPGKGQKRFLPSSNLAGRPLLRVFNLDILNVQGDPQPDGVFDFVPGITINPRNGRIMFPVLEPFGESLSSQLDTDAARRQYVYQDLYDKTIFLAQENQTQNRFVIRGEYKSSVSNEISLGAFNIPPGSVTVRAGGQVLQEGADYEVDYNIGRVRILNDAILNSGVPVNVSFEDNTLFGFQTKTMLGLRADYQFDENFNIGATYLQLFERPFTQKVNIGDDPINNRMYGIDMNLSREAPWLTRAVDALPLYSTKAPSNLAFNAEAAYLQPGHSRAINLNTQDEGGVVYIDDFEGSASSFDLRIPANNWFLASVPQNDAENNNPMFPESNLVNDIRSGANRARLNWYRIDPNARNADDDQNPYTSLVRQEEVFPNLQLTPDQLPNIQTLDLSFHPAERGTYNFDIPGGYPGFTQGVSFLGDSLVLNDPETRWGGIMRELNTNDFQTANIEFLEFWMLSPFLEEADVQTLEGRQGELYINLGNISEDILRDSRKFFENGLPGPFNPDRRVDTTNLSAVPTGQQITRAFDNDPETRNIQDVGLDGLDNEAERRKFSDYLNTIRTQNPVVADKLAIDPSYDDYRFFNHPSFDENDGVINRYRDFNNPQGNSRANDGNNTRQTATNLPDAEDINNDNTLNETESYFQYRVPLRFDPTSPRDFDPTTPFITDRQVSPDGQRVWYRFRIPLNGPDKVSVGGIQDFRSIRFIRMYLKGFEEPVVLRFARLELVRNQWRRYNRDLAPPDIAGLCEDNLTNFDIDAVNIEENSSRMPFNYVLPEGIQREQSVGVFNALQNEQSLSLRINNLCSGDARAVFRIINLDMRVYERLKMFVHAEAPNLDVPDGATSVFLRLGSDLEENYYEYEIPLVMSKPDDLPNNRNSAEYKNEVWRPENIFDFPLSLLVDLKKERNRDGISLNSEFMREVVPDNSETSIHKVKIKGNPNLGFVKVGMIGVRNDIESDGAQYSLEVWANELRLTGLDERGGFAAIARMDMQMADLGNLTVAGNYSSIGFGGIDQKVQQRARESVYGYDVATTLELGKFFPEEWGIRLPFYAQVSNTTRTPEFDPYDLDVKLKDKVDEAETSQDADSIRTTAQEVQTIKSYNFTNVGKVRTGQDQGPPKPWDIENFSFNYSFTETEQRDPIIEMDRERRYQGGVDYNYTRQVKYIEPFKKMIDNDKYLKWITDFNFNPIPNTFTFSTILDRKFAETRYRFAGLDPRFNTFYNKRFLWDRDYNLQWDLTRTLKINFNATNAAVIDEPDEIAVIDDPTITDRNAFRRDSIWENLRNFGRTKNYQHNLNISYNVPLKNIPFIGDLVQLKLQYQSGYSWTAAALNTDSLGNVIQNSQTRQANIDLNFERLYDQIPYIKDINKSKRARKRTNRRSSRPSRGKQDANKEEEEEEKKKRDGPSTIERALIRPLLMLRKARLNYSEQFRTVVPGFMPQTQLLGLSSGFEAPGLDFVAGLQPNIRRDNNQDPNNPDWLEEAAGNGWLTRSVFLNQEIIQDYTQNYNVQVTLEPFADFRLELEARRQYTENHTQFFKILDKDGAGTYDHTIPKDIGSMTISYSALNTLFQDSREQIIGLFGQFEQNRATISQRLGDGSHANDTLAAQGYTFGYGRTQQDVLLPAFIAAYTGQDANSVDLNVFNLLPRVNWRLTYNGLSRLPWFENIFDNFTVTHGYQSTLTVNQFNTGLDFLRSTQDPLFSEVNPETSNFYARLEIPEVAIQESFSPLLAVDATLKNGMSFNLDFKKSRTLAMSFINNQLSETQTQEYVIGFGYLLRDVNLGGIFGGKKTKKKKEDDKQPQSNRGRGGGNRGRQLQGRDLDINFNFSLRDDVTFAHRLDEGVIEPVRGTYALSISPSAEYQINRRLSLRFFFDYRRNVPKTSAGFPRTDTSGGVVVRFQLN
jgi:cell surface protein SprA